MYGAIQILIKRLLIIYYMSFLACYNKEVIFVNLLIIILVIYYNYYSNIYIVIYNSNVYSNY